MPVKKSPFTNTAKSSLFCSPKVNISLLFTEDLQNGEILGEDRINSGFCWGIATGICYVILAGEGGAVDGDAEPSTASGGCSEAEHP